MQNQTMTDTKISKRSTGDIVIWCLCLIAAPLALLVIELFHPANFTESPGMWAYLSQPEAYNPSNRAIAYTGPHWWFILHMIQTPLVGLVAIGLWSMVKDLRAGLGLATVGFAWLARIAIFVMLIYFTALDSIGGFGLGRYIIVAQSMASDGALTGDQIDGIIHLLNFMWLDPWVGGEGSFVSETASWASFCAALFAAIALFLARRAPVVPLIVLVAFGWTLQVSHAAFHGPIAFGLLIVASIWIWFRGGEEAGRVY